LTVVYLPLMVSNPGIAEVEDARKFGQKQAK